MSRLFVSSSTNSITLTLIVQPGYRLALTGFSMSVKSDSLGYNRWTLKMNGVDLASDVMVRGGAMVSTGLWTFAPVRSNLTGTVTLTLTLLGNQSVTSAFTWDNFVLKGFVQQVPTGGTSQTMVAGKSYRYGFNRQRVRQRGVWRGKRTGLWNENL